MRDITEAVNFLCRFALPVPAIALVTLVSELASAHPMGFGSADIALKPGGFVGELVLDSPPEFTDPGPAKPEDSEKPPDTKARGRNLQQQVEDGFVLVFDNQPAKTNARVLSLGTGPTAMDVVRISGKVPDGAKTVVVRTSTEQGDMGVELGGPLLPDALRGLVPKGSESSPLHLGPNPPAQPWRLAAEQSVAEPSGGRTTSRQEQLVSPKSEAAKPEPFSLSFLDYTSLGFRHIVPHGIDHVLFVVGLLLSHTLLTGRWAWLRSLVLQLSVFTLAHSVTLALGALGLVSINPDVIEPLIALSIVYVGVEPLLVGFWLERAGAATGPRAQRLALWRRSSVVFLFGLLHGLGFASALSTRGLDPGALFSSLLAFNLGVEGGQLCIAGAGAALCFGLRTRPFYKAWVLTPLCAAIAAIGVFWFFERIS